MTPNNLSNYKVSLGRVFPHEFIDTLTSTAGQTLRDWLELNGAPQQVIDLVDNAIFLAKCTEELKAGKICDYDAAWLVDCVPETARLVAELGGMFHGPDGATVPREPAVSLEKINAWRSLPRTSSTNAN